MEKLGGGVRREIRISEEENNGVRNRGFLVTLKVKQA